MRWASAPLTGFGLLAYDALQLMENHKPRPIMVLPVLDGEDRPLGMINIHTLLQAGFKAGKQQ